jgi:hypothetical protein
MKKSYAPVVNTPSPKMAGRTSSAAVGRPSGATARTMQRIGRKSRGGNRPKVIMDPSSPRESARVLHYPTVDDKPLTDAGLRFPIAADPSAV